MGYDIELRHFHYFVAVAEELHFGHAAERLNMAQPPLSMQIKQLESRVGVQLLERNRRHVALTAAGALFLEDARRVIDQADRAVQKAREAGLGLAGRLHIGFVASAPFNVLPDILRQFRRHYPTITVTLSEMATAVQVQSLHQRAIDVGFVRLPVDSAGLSTRRLLREPLVAALPESHPLARKRRIEVRSLAGEPFIIFPRTVGAGLYDQIIRLCVDAGFSPTITQEASLMQTIIGLVGAGMGVSLVPQSVEHIHGTGVVYRPLVRSPLVEMGMAWRQDDPSPLLKNFLALIPSTDVGGRGARRGARTPAGRTAI